jgi:WD40 repeat protein
MPLCRTVAVAGGAFVAAAGAHDQVEVWDARDTRRVSTLRGSTAFVSSIAFDAGSDLLAAGSFDHAARV